MPILGPLGVLLRKSVSPQTVKRPPHLPRTAAHWHPPNGLSHPGARLVFLTSVCGMEPQSANGLLFDHILGLYRPRVCWVRNILSCNFLSAPFGLVLDPR
jgi:hypothetical protein